MPKDFLLDESGDLMVKDGDFVIGECIEQNISLMLATNQGEWKANPLAGFGYIKRLKGLQDDEQLSKDLDTAMQLDKHRDIQIKVENGLFKEIRSTQ